MIRHSRPFSRLLPVAIAALLAAGVPGGALCHAASPPKAPGSSNPSSQPTIDPQPPLSLEVEVIGLQKNPRGGVASLLFKVSASVGIAEAVVSARTPGDLVFADGSTVKTWNVDLASAGAESIPVDVIVPEDGKYVITAEVGGTVKGKPIRRGAAARLLVGVREPAPKVKDGAIEYPAFPAEGA